MKPIRFSPHAEANLVAREISRATVEATIRQPDRREPSRPPLRSPSRAVLRRRNRSPPAGPVVFNEPPGLPFESSGLGW